MIGQDIETPETHNFSPGLLVVKNDLINKVNFFGMIWKNQKNSKIKNNLKFCSQWFAMSCFVILGFKEVQKLI